MLILEMILKITGWTQDTLANFLGISRATINYILNGNSISLNSKKIISDKFNFPISYFDISLDSNIESYKIMYATLYKSINELKLKENKTDKDKILDILNKIEINEKSSYHKSISELDIINGLVNGYNPFTGEIFDDEHILNNKQVKEIITKLKIKYYKYGIKHIEFDDLSPKQKSLFDKLREWRKNKSFEEGYNGAYMVFSDEALLNLVCGNIRKKEDLLNIKGIGKIKYNKYGEEVYKILNSCVNYQ